MSITVLGSVAFDEIETPFGKSGKIIGGSATHFSYAASKFKPVNIISIVGNDFPKSEIKNFNQNNINTENLEFAPNQKTFFWKGKYHMDMNTRDTITTELNAFENYTANISKKLRKPEFLMLANITPANQLNILSQLEAKPDFIVLDTMNLWIDISKDELQEVIKKVDLLMLNDSEARQLTNEFSLVKAAKKMIDMGVDKVVIKKGEHGALMFHHNHVFAIPGMPLEDVFDPTGAGDSFAGGFLGHIAKTKNTSFENLKNAILVGSATASLCVESFGVEKLKSISKQEIDNRVNDFINMVTLDIELK